jgi:hypothetical protein
MPGLRDKIVVIAFLVTSALPFVARRAHVRDHEVNGALEKPHYPELSFATLKSETFQDGYKAWFESRLALKGYSIYIDNSVLYHALGDTKTGSTVRIGRDGVLFLDEDIWYFNRDTVPFVPAQLDAFATRIEMLQTKLRARHRAFVPVIIPSKTTIYRDKVPSRWTRALGDPPPSDDMLYRTMKRALDAHHIAYVDAREMFTTSTQPRALLWGTTGRHWTAYGACLALQEVGRRFAELTGKSFDYDCPLDLGAITAGNDDLDLLNLLNAWGVPSSRQSPGVRHAAPPPGEGPSVLFIGTSFCWALLRDAEASHRFASEAMDYYNKVLVVGPDNAQTPVVPHSAAWKDHFLGDDLYVLDLFESYYGAPDSFIEHFLDELSAELL